MVYRNIVLYRRVFHFLVTANVVPSSPIRLTLVMEVIPSPKTSVLTKATRCKVSEDSIHLFSVDCQKSTSSDLCVLTAFVKEEALQVFRNTLTLQNFSHGIPQSQSKCWTIAQTSGCSTTSTGSLTPRPSNIKNCKPR
jgi:hypothetical protein